MSARNEGASGRKRGRVRLACAAVGSGAARTFDLPFHREEEQRDEVHQQDRPKHGYVEHAEEGHHERDDEGLRERVPELELW